MTFEDYVDFSSSWDCECIAQIYAAGLRCHVTIFWVFLLLAFQRVSLSLFYRPYLSPKKNNKLPKILQVIFWVFLLLAFRRVSLSLFYRPYLSPKKMKSYQKNSRTYGTLNVTILIFWVFLLLAFRRVSLSLFYRPYLSPKKYL
jgi:hypothetical protein